MQEKHEAQLVATIKDNTEGHTKQQQERAKEARKLCHIAGAPTVKNFKFIIESNQTQDCPITVDDVDIAEQMCGKDISHVKGKTTW